MKFKRTSAAILAAALAIPSTAICAYAAEDEAMKTELTYVKQRIDIPEDYTEFSYRTSTEQNGTRYNFTWEKKDSTHGERINVGIVGKVIKNVYVGNYYGEEDEWKPSFAKLSDSKILAAAKKYINEINPTIADRVKINEDSLNISLYGKEATLSFKRTANDVDVTGQTGSVTVDKNTGKLIRYNFNWINGATFSDTKDAISKADAQKAYKELFPVELVYTLSYDWEKDENGDLVLDEEGNPVPILKEGQEIPKEYERDEEGELVLDEEGNPIVTFTVPETSVLIESITDVLDKDRSIDIYVNWGDQEPALGSVAEFVTVLHGYDRVEYVILWQHSKDDQNWENISGVEGPRYRVKATKDNYQDYWRVKVIITKIKK